jgi:hypothetical protein
VGEELWFGYVLFGFENSTSLLEHPFYGNAVYVLSGAWTEMVHRTKAEIRGEFSTRYIKVNHVGDWIDRIRSSEYTQMAKITIMVIWNASGALDNRRTVIRANMRTRTLNFFTMNQTQRATAPVIKLITAFEFANSLPAPHWRRPLFKSDDAFFVIVKLRLDPVESFDDFIKAPVHIGFQIVEALVLRPLGNPDCGHERNHNRQRDGQKLLESRVHPFAFYQPNRLAPEPN